MTWQKRLRELENNWDGYNADPPSELAIQNAQLFIEQVGIEPSRVTVSAVGGVAVTYHHPTRNFRILVEFYNKGTACALASDRQTGAMETFKVNVPYINYAAKIEGLLQ